MAERNSTFHPRHSSNKNIGGRDQGLEEDRERGQRKEGEGGGEGERDFQKASLCVDPGIFNFTSLRTPEITFDQQERSTSPSPLSMPQIVFVKEMCAGAHQKCLRSVSILMD